MAAGPGGVSASIMKKVPEGLRLEQEVTGREDRSPDPMGRRAQDGLTGVG